MLTNADIKKLKKIFVTKEELSLEVDKINSQTEKLFLILMDSINQLRKELSDFRKEMQDYKERTNKTIDFLFGSYKKFDEEHSVLTARYSTIGKTIDNHEIRITTLEKKPS